MVLSLEARLFLVEQMSRGTGGYTEAVQRKFAEKFPDTHIPHRNTVRQLVAKVRETGSVADAPRSGRPPVLTEEKIRDISNHKLQCPTKSLRKLSQQTGVSSSSAYRALKHLHPHPRQITSVHELEEKDSMSKSTDETVVRSLPRKRRWPPNPKNRKARKPSSTGELGRT